MDTKTRLIYVLFTSAHFSPEDTYKLKVRRWKKITHANGNQRKAIVEIIMSDKVDFKIK